MSWAPLPRVIDNPIDRAMVMLLKAPNEDGSVWCTNLGVHLWVGAPQTVPHGQVRVWLHEKSCATRASPQRVKSFVDDYHNGRCWECDSLPLIYVRKRAWWPFRLTAWILRRVFGVEVWRSLGPARVRPEPEEAEKA